jgi:hypothetical protein
MAFVAFSSQRANVLAASRSRRAFDPLNTSSLSDLSDELRRAASAKPKREGLRTAQSIGFLSAARCIIDRTWRAWKISID